MKSNPEVDLWRSPTQPGYRISHELHDADFGVLPGARSESVGNEWERAETPPPPLLRWLGVAVALIVVSIVLAFVLPLLRSQS